MAELARHPGTALALLERGKSHARRVLHFLAAPLRVAAFLAVHYPTSPNGRLSARKLASLSDFARSPFWRAAALRDAVPGGIVAIATRFRLRERSAVDVATNCALQVGLQVALLPVTLALTLRAYDTSGGYATVRAALRAGLDASRVRTAHARQSQFRRFQPRPTASAARLLVAELRPVLGRFAAVHAIEALAASPWLAAVVARQAHRLVFGREPKPRAHKWTQRCVTVLLCGVTVALTASSNRVVESLLIDIGRYTTEPVPVAAQPPVPHAEIAAAAVRLLTLLL